MLLVLCIALLCTAKWRKGRSSIRDVLTMLGEAKPRHKEGQQREAHLYSSPYF
ncbi:hypothetical protein AMTRI_Chr07g76980 [Amborella trichopoda]